MFKAFLEGGKKARFAFRSALGGHPLAASFSLPAQNLLENGDLEAEPFLSGWVSTANVPPFAGLAPSSTKSAMLSGGGQRIGQNLASFAADWYLDFYFAIRDAGANRAFSLMINQAGATDNVNAATINLRYQSGQFNAYAAGSFGSDLGLGTVDFSADANNDGDFAESGGHQECLPHAAYGAWLGHFRSQL